MEFYINHTRQEIFRAPADEWEEDDEVQHVYLNIDSIDEVAMMNDLIDIYEYYMDPLDRDIVVSRVEEMDIMEKQYQAAIEQETNDATGSIETWAGWDEPGASFDY